jgi:type IV pilus assembly protein PilY1
MLTTSDADPTPWKTDRKVVTMYSTLIDSKSDKAVPFLWDQLSTAEQTALGSATKGPKVLQFIRGDRSKEGTRLNSFRLRNKSGMLGDIVNSQPVVVGPPKPLFGTSGDTAQPIFLDAGYDDFFAKQKKRETRIYVGANDGMLHAFDDKDGSEAWAYVPKGVYRADNTSLRALVYQDGGLPAFSHHYLVDGPVRSSDVNYGGGDSDWHTMLVGGLGKGGKSYYAIDVTDPATMTDENKVAANVLWEYTDDDMGYTYGKPLIVKTYAYGWTVILTAGYNNKSGHGKIYFLDPKTGVPLRDPLETTAGDATTPSGLAQVSGYVKNFRNQVVEELYAGDLLGNLWRFDVSDKDSKNWTVNKMATFQFPGDGSPQPITTAPQIEIDIKNGVDRWVFVGTGRLLDDSDLYADVNKLTQSMYALRDGTTTTPNPIKKALTRSDLVEVSGITGLSTKPDNGWYDDLTDAVGQRVVVPVQAELGIVAYIATQPPGSDPCLIGQPARIYAREYALGNSRLQEKEGGPFSESFFSENGGVGIELIALANSDGSASGYYPNLRLGVTQGIDGKMVPIRVALPADVFKHRMSWRMLTQ